MQWQLLRASLAFWKPLCSFGRTREILDEVKILEVKGAQSQIPSF
jgi:hypothetical protein